MNNIQYILCGMTLCVGLPLVNGCDNADEIEYAVSTPAYDDRLTDQERVDQLDNTMMDDTPNSDMTGMANVTNEAPGATEPHKPLALQATVQFEEGSIILDQEARDELVDFIDGLESGRDHYLTIRLMDEDTLDVTDPTDKRKELNQKRAEKVIVYLNRQGVNFADVAIDESGVVSNYGEGNPMARPDLTADDENAQYATITIEGESPLLP